MSDEAIWATILGMGAITYGLRLSLILLLGRVEISPRVRQALRFVPPAVLSALILPEVVLTNGALDLGNNRLLAALVASVVAWKVKNTFVTVAAGLVTLWIVQALR
ncbi:MAG: AzlD domain-containing protein [bacterium]